MGNFSYRYTKSIIKGITSTNVSGGQFITFDGKKCFESDKYGNNVGNGLLAYDKNSEQAEIYWGGCYFSQNAYFKFYDNRTLLNIETNNGRIYVFKRATPPNGITTCSLIKQRVESSDNSGGTLYAPVRPTYPQGNYGGTPPSVQSRDRREQKTTTGYEMKKKVRRTCAACNGKGTYEYNGPGASYGSNPYKMRCPTCGWEYWSNTIHSHRACQECHGRGYIEEWL